uniref:SGNH hydrolase-type esterase domain-containing protein n=1 Tax=Larimichthys crocea TaxID=215358 RepID=A0A0F8AZE7_LARCR
MAVCMDCTITYSQLKNEIQRLESELRKRDQLIEGFVSVAAAQSKHISHLQSSTFTAPPAPSPPSPMSPVVSDSAATLPWQATMHTGMSPLPARPEDRPCEKSGLSLDREPDVETVGTTRAAASSLDTSTLPIATQTPSADPGAYSGHGTNTPVHTSTPNRANTCPRPSWTEVVRRGRSRVSAGPYPQPPLAISNRFTILPKDASVHPDDAPAASTSPVPEVTSAASAASHGKATRRSSAVNDRRMLLKEAVIRRSGGLPGGSLKQSPRLCPPAQTPHSGLSTSKPREAAPTECLQRLSGGPHISSPRPLFPPTAMIIGDSITRDIRFINAATHCFPGATVPHILDKLLEMMHSLPTAIKRIIVHVGTNDTTRQESERTKNDFKLLFDALKNCGKSVFISGPIPTVRRGAGRFSRLLSLHTWLQSTSRIYNFGFIDNFNLFWDRDSLFKLDGIHPNKRGSQMLCANLQHAVHTFPCD